VEKEFDLDLRDCLELAAAQYSRGVIAPGSTQQALDYMIERFRAWYEEEQIPVEVFRAVSARNISRPADIERRVRAVHAFTRLPEAAALAAANKRVSNILEKVEAGHRFAEVNPELLREPQEIELSSKLTALAGSARRHLERDEYAEALASLAALREPVDAFFDGVLVNVDDTALRHNRLNLLRQLRELFLQVADISQLVVGR
jgi:glycyl-tRNA synthetase beta chain